MRFYGGWYSFFSMLFPVVRRLMMGLQCCLSFIALSYCWLFGIAPNPWSWTIYTRSLDSCIHMCLMSFFCQMISGLFHLRVRQNLTYFFTHVFTLFKISLPCISKTASHMPAFFSFKETCPVITGKKLWFSTTSIYL